MISRTLISAILLMGLSCAVEAQSPEEKQGAALASVDVHKLLQHLMDLQVAFTNPPPPGISIATKEVARAGSSGRDLVVQYHVFIKGLKPGVLLTESELQLAADELTENMEGISVGKDAILMCAGRVWLQCGDAKKPDDPIEFTFQPLKGEPYRLVFVAGGETKIPLMIVPDPVEAHDKGCTLSAVRMIASFQVAFISGTGYPPDTDIHYRVDSSDAVIRSDAKGVIRTSVLVHSNGKKNGQASVEVLEKSCSPKVSYDWGNP